MDEVKKVPVERIKAAGGAMLRRRRRSGWI